MADCWRLDRIIRWSLSRAAVDQTSKKREKKRLPRSGGTGTPTAATRAGAHAYSPSNEPLAEAGACQMCDLCPVADTVKFLGNRRRMGRKGRKGVGDGEGDVAATWSRIPQSRIPHASWRLRLKITPPEGSSLCACRARTLPRMRQKFRQSCSVPWGVAWRGLKSAGARLRRAGPPAAPAAGLVCAYASLISAIYTPSLAEDPCKLGLHWQVWLAAAASGADPAEKKKRCRGRPHPPLAGPS